MKQTQKLQYLNIYLNFNSEISHSQTSEIEIIYKNGDIKIILLLFIKIFY